MTESRQKQLQVGVVVLATLALCAANIYFGDLNQDEGWYLYAARQIGKGFLPYRDFFFTQAPVTPFVFALTEWIWGGGGLLGARCLNAAFGVTTALLAAWLAWRMAPRRFRFFAALTSFALVACNVYQSYFTAVIKTYSLAGLFLTGGALALCFCRGRRGIAAVGLAGILFSVAAGARISMGMALPVAGLYLLWHRNRIGRRHWVAFGMGAVFGLACVFGSWLVICADPFMFAMGFHSQRAGGSLASLLLFKAGFLSRSLNAYFVVYALLAVAAAGFIMRFRSGQRAPGDDGDEPPAFVTLLFALVASVSALHMAAPFPYDDYQVPVFPLLAAATAVMAWKLADGMVGKDTARTGLGIQWVVLGIVIAQGWTSPASQAWFVYGRDRFWWLQKQKPDIVVLREVAKQLNAMHPEKGVLLTQDTYLAVEAGWSVPAGFEMGPFSYFPDLPTATAKRYRVLNREILAGVLETCEAPLGAFSGYGFAISSPSTEPVGKDERDVLFDKLARRYEQVGAVPAFGQAHTLLTLWRRRPEAIKP